MKRILIAILSFVCCLGAGAQPSRVLTDRVRTLQVVANDNPLLMPVVRLDDDQWVDIDLDVMTHEYSRLVYRIEHCDAAWQPTDGLFDSDYLDGMDGLTIDDYEESLNTSMLYTHYHLRIPNENVRVRLSGNYRVSLIDEERDETVAEACFMAVDPRAMVRASVTTRTDADLNGRHQQVELEVGYGTLRVVDPQAELTTVVMQNRRWDNRVVCGEPNLQNHNSIGYTHRRELIFDAGTECSKFEMLDKHDGGLGVDHIEYHAPYEHLVLYAIQPTASYTYDEDRNGVFVVRNARGDAQTESEYMIVHFALDIDRVPDDVYVMGDFTHGQLLPECRLRWDDEEQIYEGAVPLKQGYYEYRFVGCLDGRTRNLCGDHYEARNEYATLVYYRERGGRYDQLVAYNLTEIRE